MVEKPDYVLNFVRPANTEIKYIRGHWYLYERSNVYDPRLGRPERVDDVHCLKVGYGAVRVPLWRDAVI